MNGGELSVPTSGTWVRRGAVVALFGFAGLLTLGPTLEVLSTLVVPAVLMIVWRRYQRTMAEARALRTGRPVVPPMSKRSYAVLATICAASLSLPLWILCNKLLIAFTLAPAIICIWFAVYLMRGT